MKIQRNFIFFFNEINKFTFNLHSVKLLQLNQVTNLNYNPIKVVLL